MLANLPVTPCPYRPYVIMKLCIFISLLISYLLWSTACQHPDLVTPFEPNPIDTTQLTCEDTIEVNFPGAMEHGYLESVKTCRIWKASGQANNLNIAPNHLFVSGATYYPYIELDGDTIYLSAEAIVFTIPRKTGRFPIINLSGFHKDTAKCSYSLLDNDVFLANWQTDGTFPENEVEVTELDLINKRVKGNFSVHLIIDATSANFEAYQPRFHFFDGAFDVEILD